MTHWAYLAGGIVLTCLLLAVGHWMPFIKSRFERYIYGAASIIAGFCLWRLTSGDWITPLGLVLISIAGGITTLAVYRADEVARRIEQAEIAEALHDEFKAK